MPHRQNCVPLDDKKIALLIDAAWKETVAIGHTIIEAPGSWAPSGVDIDVEGTMIPGELLDFFTEITNLGTGSNWFQKRKTVKSFLFLWLVSKEKQSQHKQE